MSPFTESSIDAITDHSQPIFKQHHKELGEAVHNDLFDLDGPREVKRDHSPRDYFMAEVFRGFTEVDESFRTLEDIAFYIRRFPFSRTMVTKERYLQFHVECYYAEVYLLRERLKSYLKFIGRRFKRDPSLPSLQATCQRLEEVTTEALKGVTNVRSHHVHQARMSDKAIDRMKMVSLLMLSPDPKMREIMVEYHSQLHREAKRTWSRTMKGNNAAISKLLDVFFGTLEPALFNVETGKIRQPKHIEA
jgi:hypothetical protein